MINMDGETLIEHHVKYKEIHGYDETIWMTWSEHTKLHRRLRNEGGCNITPDKLKKISNAAYSRTNKAKARKGRRLEIIDLKCTRCCHEWAQQGATAPKRCPSCNSPYWDKERVRAATVQKIVAGYKP